MSRISIANAIRHSISSDSLFRSFGEY